MAKQNILKYYLLVILTGIIFGLIVFGGKVFSNLGLSLFEISFFPYAISLVVFFFILYFRRGLILKKGLLTILILYGFLTSLCILGQFGSVILGLPVAIGVLLLYTQPFWTTLYSGIFLKEKLTPKDMISCLLVLLGVLLLVNPWGSFHITSWVGFAAGLIGGIGLSGWVITGSIASKKGNHPTNTAFWGSLFLVMFLIIILQIIRIFSVDPKIVNFSFSFPADIWIYVITFSLFTAVIAHLTYFYGVKKVPTVEAGVILLLEPIVGIMLAAIFLGQAIEFGMIIGGILILLANYLVITQVSAAEN